MHPPAATTGIFGYFGYSGIWSEHREPIGSNRQPGGEAAARSENEKVAWVMTCAARVPDSRTADELAKAAALEAQLSRDGRIAADLYEKLRYRSREHVTFTEIEELLGCQWGERQVNIGGQTKLLDLYFYKMIATEVEDGLSAHVKALDIAMCRIRGLEALQTTLNNNSACERAVKVITHKLSRLLLDRKACANDMINALLEIRANYVADHVESVKVHLNEQMIQLQQMVQLVDASRRGNLEDVIDEHEHAVHVLVNFPPREFQRSLDRSGVSLSALRGAFVAEATGLVESVCRFLPPSGASRCAALEFWLKRHGNAVFTACVNAINSIYLVVNAPYTDAVWSGINIVSSAADPLFRKTLSHDEWSDLPVVKHLDDKLGTQRMLVQSAGEEQFSGLRVARLVDVLIQQVRLGLLPPCTLCAQSVLPALVRLTADTSVEIGMLVDMQLNPIASKNDCNAWPSKVQYGKRSISPCDEEMLLPPTLPPPIAPPPQQPRSVPDELKRDHAMLTSLLTLLNDDRTFSIGNEVLMRTFRALAPTWSGSDAELRQVAAFVVKRLISLANAPTEDVAYHTRTNHLRRVVGLCFTNNGRDALRHHIAACLSGIEGTSAHNVWQPTRKSRSAAKRQRRGA